MKKIESLLQQTKSASYAVAKLSAKKKRDMLLAIVDCLKVHKEEIIDANKKDITKIKSSGATNAFIDRLTLTEKGFTGMLEQLKTVAHLENSVGEIIEQRTLTNGIQLKKMRFPLGVVLMIYESRPNVTIDVAGLCLQSGNAVILKGGSEALHTNKALVACIHQTLKKYDVPVSAMRFLKNITHAGIKELLKRNDVIDVVIPRGSYTLTTTVAEESRIPILYHASGGARMYVDKSADITQALEICVNAKTNRTGVCNSLDVVLVHKAVAENFLKRLDIEMWEKGFETRANTRAKEYMRHAKAATMADFVTEFLDSILAVKVVEGVDEGVAFIKKYTHHHTEVLAAEDRDVIEKFIREIDAAGLMINCSSRLHDGGEFGMGAEMGTATGKLHARGPVGVRELTTYKWIAYGNGQIKK